jgi:hypothetical protein
VRWDRRASDGLSSCLSLLTKMRAQGMGEGSQEALPHWRGNATVRHLLGISQETRDVGAGVLRVCDHWKPQGQACFGQS